MNENRTDRDVPIVVRDANGDTQQVDNTRVTNEQSQRILRQQVRDPDAIDALGQILVTLDQILAKQGLPNPATGAQRMQLTAIDAALTLATITTVASLTNLAGVAGFSPIGMPFDPFYQQAAAQRRLIEVG